MGFKLIAMLGNLREINCNQKNGQKKISEEKPELCPVFTG